MVICCIGGGGVIVNAAICRIISVWFAVSCAIALDTSGAIVVPIPNVLPGSVTVGAATVRVVPSVVVLSLSSWAVWKMP
jgi:hypothetical protein